MKKEKFFNDQDHSFFHNTMEKIESVGESIGTFFNKKTTWFVKGLAIAGCLVLFGSMLFVASLIKNAVSKKK